MASAPQAAHARLSLRHPKEIPFVHQRADGGTSEDHTRGSRQGEDQCIAHYDEEHPEGYVWLVMGASSLFDFY